MLQFELRFNSLFLRTSNNEEKNMAKPTKESNGIFKIQVFLGVDVSGKKHTTTLRGFSSPRKALEAAENARVDFRENRRNVIVTESKITLQEYFDETWWPFYQLTVGESTWIKAKQVIHQYILPQFGKMKLKDITPKLLNPYVRKTWQALSNYRRPINYFQRILDMAVADELIEKNPFDLVKLPNKRRSEKPRKSWSKVEVERILVILPEFKINHQMAYTYLYLMLMTGMRRGEVSALKWTDIDFGNGKLTIKRSLKTGNQKEYVGDTKTQSSHRSIILPVDVLAELQQWRQQVPQDREYIFTTKSDTPINLARPYKWVKQLEEMAHVPHLGGTHVLRHTFATMALEAGVNPKVVQAQLGHATSEMTMNVYAEVDASRGIDAGEAVSNFLRLNEVS